MQSDRRIAPRVNCEIAAEVHMLFGDSIDVQVIDLSVSGCQIVGGEQLMSLKSVASGAPLEFNLHFGLDGCPIHTFCRVIYQRRERQNRYAMGLRWSSIPEHQLEILQRFVDERLAKGMAQSSASA